MIKNVDQLADRLKGIKIEGKEITFDMLKDAISSESEIELEITHGTFLTDEGLSSLKNDVKKLGYEEARTPIKEMTMKELRDLTGLEFEGYKDPKKFVETFKNHVLSEAKIEPNKKIEEYKSSLEKLQSQYEQDISFKDQLIKQKESALKDVYIESKLSSMFPKEILIKPDHAAKLLKMDYSIDLDENNNLKFMKNGVEIKDKLEKPIPHEQIINDYVQQNNWIPATDGRGGTDGGTKTGDFKDINELMKYMEENKIDPTSSEGIELTKKFNA